MIGLERAEEGEDKSGDCSGLQQNRKDFISEGGDFEKG